MLTMSKLNIKAQINKHIGNLYPGCRAEFIGQQSRAALKSRTFGFRIKDQRTGRYHSNIIWMNSDYSGEINEAWVKEAIKKSNG
jgi:hypothetical protein